MEELTRQKDSIATHLAQVRQLLGGQLPGMDAAVQAPAAKPAIAAEPAGAPPTQVAPAAPPTQVAPAAPASAPRNGNGGPVAPTTVQPAQQPAAVRPPGHPGLAGATAAQQRPANGGAPAPAPAPARRAKQAANGKEDDEDWWTE